jgi:hypothetical protein
MNHKKTTEILNEICQKLYGVEYLPHDCHRDSYGQDSCPVCDEVEMPDLPEEPDADLLTNPDEDWDWNDDEDEIREDVWEDVLIEENEELKGHKK